MVSEFELIPPTASRPIHTLQLDLLPERSGSAATNMATDFLLLKHYPQPDHARFRAYSWQRPAYTFGYSQKIAFVRDHLPAGFDGELCRRPTGGGIVDHRVDWTYAIVIPRGADLYDERAVESYRVIHQAITEALLHVGVDAQLKTVCEPPATEDAAAGKNCRPTAPGVCFQRAERFDVVHSRTGAKLAGAAQKRAKHGLLFQGSLARAAIEIDGAIDWDAFTDSFTTGLGAALQAEPTPSPWPDIDEVIDDLADQYSTTEWIEYR